MAYLVRFARISSRAIPLTTGTFNLIVKDRIAFRLSGALSVQGRVILLKGSLCLSSKLVKRNLVKLRVRAMGVNPLSTLDFHGISTLGNLVGSVP